MSEQKKQIFIVPSAELEGKHPHGQFLFDAPGLFMNFACEADDLNVGIIEPFAKRLDEFLRSDDPYLEFDSPHLPGRCFLTRAGAQRVVGVFPAWSDKVRPRAQTTQLVNAHTGAEIPIIGRKRLN